MSSLAWLTLLVPGGGDFRLCQGDAGNGRRTRKLMAIAISLCVYVLSAETGQQDADEARSVGSQNDTTATPERRQNDTPNVSDLTYQIGAV